MELDKGLDGEFADLNATGFMFDALLKMVSQYMMTIKDILIFISMTIYNHHFLLEKEEINGLFRTEGGNRRIRAVTRAN